MKLFFSDYFEVDRSAIEAYGAIDVSLVSDVPLFVDPFLIFYSDNDEYKKLHQDIVKYIEFLKSKAVGEVTNSQIDAWFAFKEVRQNWLGYSVDGSAGRGLYRDFGKKLNNNLFTISSSSNDSMGVHLEKLCLLEEGVGRDGISDFTVSLIKDYLLTYTQNFAVENIDPKHLESRSINRSIFDYSLGRWMPKKYTLPIFNGDFVVLTPEDILTKENTWINRKGFSNRLLGLPNSIENAQLREEINSYIRSILPEKPTAKEKQEIVTRVAHKYPVLVDIYVKEREDNGELAVQVSARDVEDVRQVFNEGAKTASSALSDNGFYSLNERSFDESKKKLLVLKRWIEDSDGYRIFFDDKSMVLTQREKDLQLLYKLIWSADRIQNADINAEVNNGRGPVDFVASNGAKDKTLIEFKVGKNKKLKQNLKQQIKTYASSDMVNTDPDKLVCITYFSEGEEDNVLGILGELEITEANWVVTVDARNDNKPSGSLA